MSRLHFQAYTSRWSRYGYHGYSPDRDRPSYQAVQYSRYPAINDQTYNQASISLQSGFSPYSPMHRIDTDNFTYNEVC